MNPDKFAKIAESLRQYRRAELNDFDEDVDGNPLDTLYVDALEGDAVLKTVLLNSTTFLVGRKGTGKSTVFAKAQIELRKRDDVISVYLDVKSLHELLSANDAVIQTVSDNSISPAIFQVHKLRKGFLGAIIADLIKELGEAYESRSLIQRWVTKARGYNTVVDELGKLASDVKTAKLSEEEIPILQMITSKTKGALKTKKSTGARARVDARLGAKPELRASTGVEAFDESIADSALYQQYADAVLRSFPFQEILARIRELLAGVGIQRLFVFFDDFSELSWIDQKLFVDVVLAPLNNASNETIRLKVAAYPGRIYYGKIDPGKIDTVGLDFYQLYKALEIQTSETSAINYLERLLNTRFSGFNENIGTYFLVDSATSLADYYRLLFEVTMNVPRLIGYILHYCYLDRIAKGLPINGPSIRLAAQKYYEGVIGQYFDRMNRFAMEPFDRKLDRHNQRKLLNCLVKEARTVRRGITNGTIGGQYFRGLSRPPVSHFAISPQMEKLLSALELNFLITKYHEMRDKSANDVSIYAFCYGLCESENFPWGYPRGRRDDRSYFVQRCFNYNSAIQQFLSSNQTIQCDECGASFGIEKKEMIEFYKWRCPECHTGTCAVLSLGDDFKKEVETLSKETMLPPIELGILEVLNEEDAPLRAREIGALVNATYQLVGQRTSKLQESGLVFKSPMDGANRSQITDRGRERYFGKSNSGSSESYPAESES